MEDTNPQGSVTDVNGAAAKIFGMLEPEQPQGQAEEPAEEVQELRLNTSNPRKSKKSPGIVSKLTTKN